jgi:hypothetical protein
MKFSIIPCEFSGSYVCSWCVAKISWKAVASAHLQEQNEQYPRLCTVYAFHSLLVHAVSSRLHKLCHPNHCPFNLVVGP